MKVYFLAGIAADSRIFKNIQLPVGYEAVFIDWITPIRDESLSSYAFRLSDAIDKSEPYYIIGVSLGGIIACEISIRNTPPCNNYYWECSNHFTVTRILQMD